MADVHNPDRLYPGDARLQPRLISWTHPTGNGVDVPVSWMQADAISLVARRMAAAHFETVTPGLSAAFSLRLRETNPEQWQAFMGHAVALIVSLYASGAHGLSTPRTTDGAAFFTALAEFGHHMNRSR